MGCGKSVENGKVVPAKHASAAKPTPEPQTAKKAVEKVEKPPPPATAPPPEEPKVKVGGSELNQLLAVFPPSFSEVRVKDKGNFLVVCVPRPDGKAVEFGTRSPTGDMYAFEMSDAQLTAQAKNVPWPQFMDTLKKAFTGGFKLDVAAVATLQFKLPSNPAANFQVALKKTTDKQTIARIFLSSLFVFFEKTKSKPGATPQDADPHLKLEIELNRIRAKGSSAVTTLAILQGQLEPLKKRAVEHETKLSEINHKCDELQRKINSRKFSQNSTDHCNAPGPNRYLLHTTFAAPNPMKEIQPNAAALALIRKEYAEQNKDASVPVAPSDVDLKRLLAAAPNEYHNSIMQCLKGIDQWDFDTFTLASHCNNGALFVSLYGLLYKYGLIGEFNIDEPTLVRFIGALESGYHPNAYHNAVHAADVLQCVHYILGPGGMIKSLSLTQEDILACLLAAGMHDYDHPGFNNNFHLRTNAYLATLYNDRSVLENHHCAQVFEMLGHEKYNIFVNCAEEQKKDIRDTILEMVLSTDMGLHAKIFQQFRRKLQDEPNWQRKEDVRLALSIAIKMADISNCARPSKLYQEWAKRIAEEFYIQGDVELKLKYAISPFMDRRKHDADFAKGQISFMNYIVIPLFEAGAQFLPDMEFAINNCQSNKEFWQNQD